MDSPLASSPQSWFGLTRRELRWSLGYAGLLVALTAVPYTVAAAQQGPDWEFTGFVVAVEDGNSYLAKMLSGWAGDWLFRSPYSAVPQRGVLAFLPYVLLGKLSSGSHPQLVWLFHLYRSASIPLLVLAVYRFAGQFGVSIDSRRWVTVLATAGGGLGWIPLATGTPSWLGSLPLEFYSPETFGFLAVLSFPHLILARAGLLWALVLYLTRASGWAAGLVLLLTGVLHAPVLVPGLAALVAHQAALILTRRSTVQWRRRFTAAVLPVTPLLAYLLFALATDPYLQAWAEQNRIRSPHPLHYLLAYGALVPAAIVGARRAVRSAQGANLLPVGWLAALPLLAYAPLDLQRRLTEGGWVALLLLAAVGLEPLIERRAVWLRIGYVGLLLPSTLLLTAASLVNLRHPAGPIYRARAEVAVFEWLASHAEAEAVVLAAYETGNALPAWAPVTVVAGHGPESAGLAELTPQLRRFYSAGASDAERLALVRRHEVDWVFWGPAERAYGSWRPSDWPCLEMGFQRGGYRVYRLCGD